MSGDHDSLGEDGYVRLRAYLRHADTIYLSASCGGAHGRGRLIDISIRRAIQMVGGDGDCSVKQFGKRLWCRACGGHQVVVSIAVDSRPHDLQVVEGVLPVIRDGLLAGPEPSPRPEAIALDTT